MEIQRLGIVGTGQMGRGIAQIAAIAGLDVLLLDSRPGAATEARDFVARMIARLVEKGSLAAAEGDRAKARLVIAGSLADLASCDLVIEAIVEDLDVKRRHVIELEAVVRSETIIASNTSSLPIAAIAGACEWPERVAGFHFFNPVPLMRLIEVVAAPRTRPSVVDALVALGARLGHTPVRVKDSPGFLVNHAGRGYGTEALRIVQEGVCEPVDIDRVMREVAGFPMGPFELLDLTALDVSDSVMRSIYHQFYEEPRFRPSPITANRLAAGLVGRKSGEGFYVYTDGKRREPTEPGPSADPPPQVWISPSSTVARRAVLDVLTGSSAEVVQEPSSTTLCLVTPLGLDATHAALAEGIDPARTVAIDPFMSMDRRVTLMTNPATSPDTAEAARSLFLAAGRKVTLIADSPGFIAQRVMAHIVNVACEIAQMRIANPTDIDLAVRLGLGYPSGPLAWGDRLGAARVLEILERLQQLTGDPRYRPSLWLRRRAALGLSLLRP